MERLNNFSTVDSTVITKVAETLGTPAYLYDEALLIQKCRELKAMPNAFGLTVRYAMKANSNKSILKIISAQGLLFDASSLNEVRRAFFAGIAYSDIMLTTQEAPIKSDRVDLESMILKGLKYNVCSLHQLHLIGDFAAANDIKLSMRVHPGVGSGESSTRNTGDNYSCFGVHLSDVHKALEYAAEKGIMFDHVHVHIGSGGDPKAWRDNIDRELGFVETYFPSATSVSFGGGLKEARMPGETAADVHSLGAYAKEKIEEFYQKTGRKLKMEIEPGTYIAANAGYAITQVIDKKKTGENGLSFIIADGGMEINTRPLLYASRHPFYIVSENGALLSSEFTLDKLDGNYEAVIVGKCCESGDAQSLDDDGLGVPRKIAEPEIHDYVVIGGAGAYCSSMSPMNYNSHTQIPEVLLTTQGELTLIRRRQTLEQILENEV